MLTSGEKSLRDAKSLVGSQWSDLSTKDQRALIRGELSRPPSPSPPFTPVALNQSGLHFEEDNYPGAKIRREYSSWKEQVGATLEVDASRRAEYFHENTLPREQSEALFFVPRAMKMFCGSEEGARLMSEAGLGVGAGQNELMGLDPKKLAHIYRCYLASSAETDSSMREWEERRQAKKDKERHAIFMRGQRKVRSSTLAEAEPGDKTTAASSTGGGGKGVPVLDKEGGTVSPVVVYSGRQQETEKGSAGPQDLQLPPGCTAEDCETPPPPSVKQPLAPDAAVFDNLTFDDDDDELLGVKLSLLRFNLDLRILHAFTPVRLAEHASFGLLLAGTHFGHGAVKEEEAVVKGKTDTSLTTASSSATSPPTMEAEEKEAGTAARQSADTYLASYDRYLPPASSQLDDTATTETFCDVVDGDVEVSLHAVGDYVVDRPDGLYLREGVSMENILAGEEGREGREEGEEDSHLKFGQVVRVTATAKESTHGVIRARIADPPGWTTLMYPPGHGPEKAPFLIPRGEALVTEAAAAAAAGAGAPSKPISPKATLSPNVAKHTLPAWMAKRRSSMTGTSPKLPSQIDFYPYLDLRGAHIVDMGASALADALKTNTVLTHLNLAGAKERGGSYRIGEKGTTALAEALRTNTHLQQLGLAWNELRDEGVEALASAIREGPNKTLTTLDLERTGFDFDGMAALTNLLRDFEGAHITGVSLANNSLGRFSSPSLSRMLVTNSTLLDIDISSNPWGDSCATELSTGLRSNSTLTALRMSDCCVGPLGLHSICRALSENLSVKILDFSRNDVGEEGAQHISTMMRMTDDGVRHLMLSETNLTDKAFITLCEEGMATNECCASLDCSDNPIGDAGAKALFDCFQGNNKTLCAVSLARCCVDGFISPDPVPLIEGEDAHAKAEAYRAHMFKTCADALSYVMEVDDTGADGDIGKRMVDLCDNPMSDMLSREVASQESMFHAIPASMMTVAFGFE